MNKEIKIDITLTKPEEVKHRTVLLGRIARNEWMLLKKKIELDELIERKVILNEILNEFDKKD